MFIPNKHNPGPRRKKQKQSDLLQRLVKAALLALALFRVVAIVYTPHAKKQLVRQYIRHLSHALFIEDSLSTKDIHDDQSRYIAQEVSDISRTSILVNRELRM